ncbi:CIS tube protein [Geodermatophilus sp. CPCC 205506]|uniref:CIS tube protein n=1 Tax=Geodermatophilus sp. CPCC 205506 TaxID=2936596 RepID=UPI003EE8CEED
MGLLMLDVTQLTKLTIEPYRDQEFTEVAGPPWRTLLNPTELAFSRKNTYQATPSAGSSAPQQSYGGGEPDQVQIDLLMDGSGVIETGVSVGEKLDQLLAFTEFQADTHQPYYVHAYWGRFDFHGVLTQVDVTYKLFDRNGEPLRATVKLTLKEVVAPEELAAEERRESPDLYQTWLVSEGERLDAIAYRVYGDPAFWRPLATVNGLRNPGGIAAGQVLRLPPKDKGGGRLPTAGVLR